MFLNGKKSYINPKHNPYIIFVQKYKKEKYSNINYLLGMSNSPPPPSHIPYNIL